MNDYNEFKPVPTYYPYSVNRYGVVKDSSNGSILNQALGGTERYYKVFLRRSVTYKNDKTYTGLVQVPVHRLVALTWVDNPDPSSKNMVNHIDGNKLNNHVDNLEWCTCSENNQHAYDTGLKDRSHKKLKFKIRDFETGEITEVSGVNAACDFMGFLNPVSVSVLTPKMFGKLINGRYEVRAEGDNRPWFYENRKERILARYKITVKYPDGLVEEYFDNNTVNRKFSLYGLKSPTMKNFAELIRLKYPEYLVTFEDSYNLRLDLPVRTPGHRGGRGDSKSVGLFDGKRLVCCDSLRSAGEFLNVDKGQIRSVIDTLKPIKGWVVFKHDLEIPDFYRLSQEHLEDLIENNKE